MNENHGPKTFADELRRMPIDYQRRVRWTFRIAAVWGASVLMGAGVFILSKPYMDRRREEKIKSGEFFIELRENSTGAKRSYSPMNSELNQADKAILPPGYLIDVIDKVLTDEEKMKQL